MSVSQTQRRPAYGPSALGGSLRRFTELTLMLARTEFKLRYFGSVLGYLWSLARPLLFFGVLYVIFTQIIKIGAGVPHYGTYLLTSIVFWNYFSEATTNCVTALLQREALLRKIRFPRLVVPLSVSLTSVFNLVLNFLAVVVFAQFDGVSIKLSWLQLLPITVGFVVLATGVGMLLSVLYVKYRDVQPIWEVLVAVLFYSSPIMYLAVRYQNMEHTAMLSPIATLLTQSGHAIIGGPLFVSAPAAAGTQTFVIALAIIPLLFALGWWVFNRQAPRVAEIL